MNIIFDLDGTLVDSVADIRTGVNMVLAEAGYGALGLSQVRSFIGEGAQMLIRQVIEAVGADESLLEDWHRAFLRNYETVMLNDTQPYPGVVDALIALKEKGARLAVCTNKPEMPARRILAATGLAPFFEAIVGGDTLSTRKPSPEPVLHAAALLGAENAIFVGDSEIDAAAAKATGFAFVLFTEGYRKAPIEKLPHQSAFNHFSQLSERVDALSLT